jgi:hypothetical protein
MEDVNGTDADNLQSSGGFVSISVATTVASFLPDDATLARTIAVLVECER